MLRRSLIAFLALVASTSAMAALLGSIPALMAPEVPVLLVEHVIRMGVLTLGGLAAGWYALTSLAVLGSDLLRLAGKAPTCLDRVIGITGAPLLRRIVTLGVASTISLGTPALAAPVTTGEDGDPLVSTVSAHDRNSTFLLDLGWAAPSPEPAATTPPAAPEVPATSEKPTEAETSADTVQVRAGDTLWAIAETHLLRTGPVTPQDVAASWPRWYAANADTIGDDPNLILPGMILHAPTLETP